MHRAGKRAVWAFAFVLGVIGAALVAGLLWLRTSLPGSGEVAHLEGLSAPVEVLRDGHGVRLRPAQGRLEAARVVVACLVSSACGPHRGAPVGVALNTRRVFRRSRRRPWRL